MNRKITKPSSINATKEEELIIERNEMKKEMLWYIKTRLTQLPVTLKIEGGKSIDLLSDRNDEMSERE
jgi:hypothetical protein